MIFDKPFKKDSSKTTESKPVSEMNYYAEGKAQFNASHYTQAMEYFQAAIAEHPEKENAYLRLADSFLAMGKKREASSTLYQLIALYPESTQAHEMLKKCQPKQAPEPPQKKDDVSFDIDDKISKRKKTHNKTSLAVSATSNKGMAEWSLKNIISVIIGVFLLSASIFGIVGCFPLHDAFVWSFFIVFILLVIFSICLILSPLLKPSWKAKDIVFMLTGLIITPIMTGLCIEDFEHNEMCILGSIMGAIFMFAPFFKVD